MQVTLISYPSMDADKLAGMAAALCYDGTNPERSLDHALGCGHHSVVEHAHFTFLVEGVSRALLAQLTRHRIASYSVQSQRYVSMKDKFDYVVPPRIKELGFLHESEFHKQMSQMHKWYCEWQETLREAGYSKEESNEDARFVLPNAATTRLMVTMNARNLHKFFGLRCCGRAQWEIREMASLMLEEVKIVAPKVFEKAGPPCAYGPCPEGSRSCGKPWRKKDAVEDVC